MRSFNNYNFPQMLDRIDMALAQKVAPTLRQHIESINHARNCFEHRNGIVNRNNERRISWVGADPFLRASEADEWEEATVTSSYRRNGIL